MIATGNAFGETRYWVGTEDSYWDWPANWSNSPGGGGGYSVPFGDDKAVFASGTTRCTVNVHIEIETLEILGGFQGEVVIGNGINLKVTTGGFTQSGGTLDGSNGNFYVLGPFELNGGVLYGNAITEINTGTVPQIAMDFEDQTEPYEDPVERPIDPTGSGNGCMDASSWNLYYVRDVCVSPTRPIDDFEIERSSQFARNGNNSLRVRLLPTPLSDWPEGPGGEATHRAELGPAYNSPTPQYPTEGEERWYGMSYYFANDFIFAPQNIANDIRFIIGQWQHGSSGPSIIALEVIGDEIVLQRQTGSSTNSNWITPVPIKTIQKGQWIDIVVQVKWSKTSGKVKIWVDGQVSFDMPVVQTIYSNLNVGGGYKMGLYYWRWKEQQSVTNTLNAGITDREIFIDEYRQYKGSNGFQMVDPASQ